VTWALVIGASERQAIAELTAKAAAEVVSHAAIMRLDAAAAEGRVTRELRDMNRSKAIHLSHGFQVVLTHEEHRPGVVCRHLSVSTKPKGSTPHPEAVAAIMAAFGFKNDLTACPLWREPCDDARTAINVLEPLDGDLSKIRKAAP
jgi:hypothetical protein